MNRLLQYALGGIFLSYLFTTFNASDGNDINSSQNNLGDKSTIKSIDQNSLDLPKIERGKYVSAEVTPEELYEAYESIRNEYDEKAFLCDNEDMNSPYAAKSNSNKKCTEKWETLRESDGVEIALLKHPSDPDCPYVRMSAIMPGPIDDVWDFLMLDRWDEVMPKMDPFYDGLEISKRYVYKNKKKKKPIEIILARKKVKRLLTFGKRDLTFVQVSDNQRDDGIRVSGTVSVITDKLPRVKGYTRAFQDSIAFYEKLPQISEREGPRTKITIMCRIDLNDSSEDGNGGSVPMWLYVKTVGSAGLLSIKSMQKELLLYMDEKEKRIPVKKVSAGVNEDFDFKALFSKLKKTEKKNVSDENEKDGNENLELVAKNEDSNIFAPIVNLVKRTKSF